MSFCCGASMIGAVGAIKSKQVLVDGVPFLFCPVCHKVDVHHSVKEPFDLLVDHALGDGAKHVDFREHVTEPSDDLLSNCISVERGNPEQLLTEQIDNALDLYGFAKYIGDREWQDMLVKRLKVFTAGLARYRQGENV